MDRRLEEMKMSYKNVSVPDELDAVINTAIKKGAYSMKKAAIRKNTVLAATFLLIILTAGVNLSPAFADTINNIPGGSTLVKALQFTKGIAIGGEVTDGKQIGPITRDEEADAEIITLPIFNDGIPADSANYFEIHQLSYPYSIIIDLSGVRYSNGSMPDFSDSKLIAGMHKLVTLDDSSERYTIIFTGPVELQVEETTNPAAIVIQVKQAPQENLTPIYSVRTASYPFGEDIGVMEQMIHEALNWQADNIRILPDTNGNLTVEAGYFSTEAEAQNFKASLLTSDAINFPLYIEQRTPTTIPTPLVD